MRLDSGIVPLHFPEGGGNAGLILQGDEISLEGTVVLNLWRTRGQREL